MERFYNLDNDSLYLAAEKAVMEDDWDTTREQYQQFYNSMQQHFKQEETVLFPDFEQVQGSTMGPTQVMRMEHEQMNMLMENMQNALDEKDKDAFLSEADTLMMFMQQHNAKEEMMLYPMSDQALAAQSDDIVSRMQAIAGN